MYTTQQSLWPIVPTSVLKSQNRYSYQIHVRLIPSSITGTVRVTCYIGGGAGEDRADVLGGPDIYDHRERPFSRADGVPSRPHYEYAISLLLRKSKTYSSRYSTDATALLFCNRTSCSLRLVELAALSRGISGETWGYRDGLLAGAHYRTLARIRVRKSNRRLSRHRRGRSSRYWRSRS